MTRASERLLYLLDSATFTLAPGIAWNGSALRDVAAGSSYPVNPTGRLVLDRQDGRVSLNALATEIASRFGISRATAMSDLRGFLGDLHGHQLVSIRQSYARELAARAQNAWREMRDRIALGSHTRFAYPNRRYPVTFWNVLAAGLEAHQPTVGYGILGALAAAMLVAAPSALRGDPRPAGISMYAGLLVLVYVVVLIASGWLHELVHCWAAGRLGLRLTSVFVRMHVFGVTHVSDDPMKSAFVSAAGPAFTALALGLLAVVVADTPTFALSLRLELAVLLLAVAAQHLPGLTPLTTDGRMAVAAVVHLARSRMAGR